MLSKMFWRVALIVLASISIACEQAATLVEPSPTELLQKARENLTNAKTAHIEGTGRFGIGSDLSISFDFKLNGDAEMPDKSRLTAQMSLLGQSLSIDTITVGGRTFSKGLMGGDWTQTAANDPQGTILDPLGGVDLTAVSSVTELDRPEIDGRKTRHLSYLIDQSTPVDKMKGSSAGTTPSLNVSGASGTGEVWIRIDDSQIVRQLVKLSVEMDDGIGIPSASPTTGSGKFDISFDIKFTRLGEPISPAITAPPTS
jgi:hypothetical protein